MKNLNNRVTEYILKSPDFARPILEYLRELVHEACPDVEESIKWQWPHYGYKGMMVSTAAFKAHVSINFWKAEIMADPHKILKPVGSGAMGNFGAVTSFNDLPPRDQLLELVREAVRLNEEGINVEKKPAARKQELDVPEDFITALEANPQAKAHFTAFSPSAQREYLQWITEAKREETRQKRIKTALEWISEGKRRNWRYESC